MASHTTATTTGERLRFSGIDDLMDHLVNVSPKAAHDLGDVLAAMAQEDPGLAAFFGRTLAELVNDCPEVLQSLDDPEGLAIHIVIVDADGSLENCQLPGDCLIHG